MQDARPFERGSCATRLGADAGKATVIHFWGLTCAPCLVELPQWAKLQAERSDLKLVLLAADPVQQEPERVTATPARAGLGGLESWSFADRFYERLRYEIDPAWAGELPRTVMIASNGTITVLPASPTARRCVPGSMPDQTPSLRELAMIIRRLPHRPSIALLARSGSRARLQAGLAGNLTWTRDAVDGANRRGFSPSPTRERRPIA